MFTEDNSAWRLAFEMTKNLGALAVKAFAEDDVWRNRLGPPIAFDAALVIHVAHEG
jgi:hypothetical protein